MTFFNTIPPHPGMRSNVNHPPLSHATSSATPITQDNPSESVPTSEEMDSRTSIASFDQLSISEGKVTSAISRVPLEIWWNVAAFSDLKDVLTMRLVSSCIDAMFSPKIPAVVIKTAEDLAEKLAFFKKTNMRATLCLAIDQISADDLKALPSDIRYLKVSGLASNEADLSELPVLNQLKALELRGPYLSSEAIATLLSKALHIKTLRLSNLSPQIFADLERVPVLEKLEFLDLTKRVKSDRVFDNECLVALLSKALNAKTVHLSSRAMLKAADLESLPVLEKLEFLNYKATMTCSEVLARLLSKTPNLKTLYIRFRLEAKAAHIEDVPELSQLEFLEYTFTTIYAAPFVALLNKTPNLRTLHLYCKTGLTVAEVAALPKLNQLETLDVSRTFIEGEIFIKLLSAAPHLKTVHFSYRGQRSPYGRAYGIESQYLEKIASDRPNLQLIGRYVEPSEFDFDFL